MVAQKGALMLMKVGDGMVSESFATLGGLLATHFTVQHEVLDASSVGGGMWRQMASGAGMLSVSIDGAGLFHDTAAEALARGAAFAGTVQNYRLYFGNGDYLQGAFIIRSYERNGDYDGEETYAMQFVSSGEILYYPG
jgi:TP901-1 family phage major tail protein